MEYSIVQIIAYSKLTDANKSYYLTLNIMKSLKLKILLVLLLSSYAVESIAQNIQLHYDFGRNAATTTVEMFRPDGGGSTFFFVDMDYSPKVVGAYWEISR